MQPIDKSGLLEGSSEWVAAVKAHTFDDPEKIKLCELLSVKVEDCTKLYREYIEVKAKLMRVTSLLEYSKDTLQKLHRALVTAIDMTEEEKGMPYGTKEEHNN
jgi:hypothetical protein